MEENVNKGLLVITQLFPVVKTKKHPSKRKNNCSSGIFKLSHCQKKKKSHLNISC